MNSDGPHPSPQPAARRVNPWVQWGGFACGVALLGWCVWLVARDQAKLEQLGKLLRDPGTFGLLLALSAGVSMSAGMTFRAVAGPVVRLPLVDLLAVNAVATLLNVLPFKLSLVARAYLHRTRNGVPVPLIIAWMAATAAVMLVSLAPPLLATLLLKRIDATWWAAAIGGTLLLGGGAVLTARLTGTERFWSWVAAQGARRPRSLGRLTGSAALAHLRKGSEMLGSPRAVAEGLAWRTSSMAFGVWRFWAAAGAVGATMTLGQCVVADSTYFAIQAGAPTGALGAREGGTVAMLAALAGDSLPVVVLAVTAAETCANLLLAGAAAMHLKLTRGRPATFAAAAPADCAKTQPASPGAPTRKG